MPIKKITRSRTQSDLTTFATVTTKPKLTANANAKAMEANAEPANDANGAATTTTAGADARQNLPKDSAVTLEGIMSAINGIKTDLSLMKTDVSTKLERIWTAMESVKEDITACTSRVSHAEARISTTEDEVAVLVNKVKCLEKKNLTLEDTVLDLETRSRSLNVRLVNLPEGAEANDACGFLEEWIPEVLELAPQRRGFTVEKAHRLGRKDGRAAESSPRTLIMKFLSHKDREAVLRAAKAKQAAKQKILYKNHPVQFYQDVPSQLHRKKKEFDGARQQLRQMGLRHGILPPARLIVTFEERPYIFTNAEEAEIFIQKIRSETQEN